MAGKRTVFSSGAVDIREPGKQAVGACSFYLDEMPQPMWASWVIIYYISHKAIFCHASCCQKHGYLDSLRSCFGSLAKLPIALYSNFINQGTVQVTETAIVRFKSCNPTCNCLLQSEVAGAFLRLIESFLFLFFE